MKKILCFAVCVIFSLSFAACLDHDAPTKETNISQQQSDGKNEEMFGLNETAVFKNLKFTPKEIKESYGTDLFVPESGNVFVGIQFEIENISQEEQYISSLLLFDAYADNVKCDYSIEASCVFSDGSLDGTVAPGKKLIGWYSAEVPSDWQVMELQVQSSWLSGNKAKFNFKK